MGVLSLLALHKYIERYKNIYKYIFLYIYVWRCDVGVILTFYQWRRDFLSSDKDITNPYKISYFDIESTSSYVIYPFQIKTYDKLAVIIRLKDSYCAEGSLFFKPFITPVPFDRTQNQWAWKYNQAITFKATFNK